MSVFRRTWCACVVGVVSLLPSLTLAQNLQVSVTYQNQGISGCGSINRTYSYPNGSNIELATVETGGSIGSVPACTSSFYRISNVVITNSSSAPNIGTVRLVGNGPLIGGQTVNVRVNGVVAGNWAGLSKLGQFGFSVRAALGTPNAISITGRIEADTIDTQFNTTGTITSTGQLVVGTTPANANIRFGSIAARTDTLASIQITTADPDLIIRTTAGNLNGRVLVGSTSFSGTGPAFRIIADSGSIGGNIEVTNGEITLVQATNGDIFNPTEFAPGQTWDNSPVPPADTFANRLTIKSPSRIRGVEAKRIAAVINADSDNSGGGQVDFIRASGTTPANSAGFLGSVNASVLDRSSTTLPAIDVAGLLKANITLTGAGNVNSPIVINQFASTTTLGAIAAPISISSATAGSLTLGNIAAAGSLSVSGTLGVPLTIASTASGSAVNINTLPSAGLVRIAGNHAGALNFGSSTVKGLDGQVVINAGNGTGTWSGVVRVNGPLGTALAPVPNYSNLASALGTDADGGAVGVVPGLGEA